MSHNLYQVISSYTVMICNAQTGLHFRLSPWCQTTLFNSHCLIQRLIVNKGIGWTRLSHKFTTIVKIGHSPSYSAMVKAHHTKCTRARRAGFENSPKKKPSKSKQSKATPLKEAKTVGLVKKASTTFAVFLRENGLNMREGSDLAYRNHGYGMIWYIQ